MGICFTKNDAMRDLPFIDNPMLFRAVNLALWLLIDNDRSLKYSISVAATKFGYKPRTDIERLIRQVVPQEFFFERMQRAGVGRGSVTKEDGARARHMSKMAQDGKNHIRSITGR